MKCPTKRDHTIKIFISPVSKAFRLTSLIVFHGMAVFSISCSCKSMSHPIADTSAVLDSGPQIIDMAIEHPPDLQPVDSGDMKVMLDAQQPKTLWAVKAGGEGYDVPTGCAVQQDGTTFVTGRFTGTADFGKNKTVSSGGFDAFVTKVDNKGSFVWALGAGGKDDDRAYGVAIDQAGNAVVTGSFTGIANFGGYIAKGNALRQVFVARIDTAGKVVGLATSSSANLSSSYSMGRSVAVDKKGNAYVVGDFKDKLVLGNTSLISTGDKDVFVARVNSTGNWDWAVSIQGVKEEFSGGIGIDGSDGIYICLTTSSSLLQIGKYKISSTGGPTLVTASLDVAGAWQWAKDLASAYCLTFDVDQSGQMVVGGRFDGSKAFGPIQVKSNGDEDAFIARLDKSGTPQWVFSGGGLFADWGWGASIGKSSLLTGLYKATAQFGADKLLSLGSNDVFLTKLSSIGVPQWTISGGGTDNDTGTCVGQDSQGNIVVVGSFGGYGVSTGLFGHVKLVPVWMDIFVWKVAGNVSP